MGKVELFKQCSFIFTGWPIEDTTKKRLRDSLKPLSANCDEKYVNLYEWFYKDMDDS